jgi:ribosome-binding factor A
MTVKQDRMQERIREILSSLLMLEVTDPALKHVTVTEVIMDRELEYADCYVNALGDETRQADVLAGLKRANGFLRREVGKRIHIRRVPVLHFHWDMTLERGDAMERKLNEVAAQVRAVPPVSETPSQEGQPSDE